MTLVERLRDGQEIYDENWSLLDEAADRIEALEKQRDELLAVLVAVAPHSSQLPTYLDDAIHAAIASVKGGAA